MKTFDMALLTGPKATPYYKGFDLYGYTFVVHRPASGFGWKLSELRSGYAASRLYNTRAEALEKGKADLVAKGAPLVSGTIKALHEKLGITHA